KYTRPFHETAEFDSDHGTPHMGETLAFHMRAFADPLPGPEVWSHIDVYPNFPIWGWEVASDRKQPGLTVLESVSKSGFHSSVRVRIWNKGDAASVPLTLQWETPNQGVLIATPTRVVPPIAAGSSADTNLLFSVTDSTREIVKLFAVIGNAHLPIEIPTFPDARPATNFRLADGKSFNIFQEGTKRLPLTIGKGNGDGQANSGEMLAVLLPDGDAWRAAELFTNDWCVDLSERASDVWSAYDHVGASAKYS